MQLTVNQTNPTAEFFRSLLIAAILFAVIWAVLIRPNPLRQTLFQTLDSCVSKHPDGAMQTLKDLR